MTSARLQKAPVQAKAVENAAPATEKSVSRDYLRGASFAEGAQFLAPGGGADLKHERSLGGGAGPVQMQKADTTPTVAVAPNPDGSIPAEANKAAERYAIKGHATDAAGKEIVDPEAKGRSIATGVGFGNRKDDTFQPVDEKDPSKGETRKNAAVDINTVKGGIPEPELDKIETGKAKEVTGAYGSYAGYDVKNGTAKGSSTDIGAKLEHSDGKTALKVEGPNAYYQKGASAKAYAGLKGEKEGKYGKVDGKAEAYGKAYAGLSGKAAIDQDGASASGAIGAGVEAGVTANADYKTPGLKVAGVDAPLDAGVGVGGEAKVYAKAGAGGGAYLTKDKVGLAGSAGIGAFAEAKANVHGNVGPVAGQFEVGALAGAGAGIEGSILYEDGRLTIGGRAYAALGYGVSSGATITIDLKQGYQLGAALLKKAVDLGIKGAQAAYRAADADGDGKLSLNDAATHGSKAMDAGAKGFERGVDGVISALDGDGDGKFDFKKDMGARANQAKDAIVNAGSKAIEKGSELYNKGKEAVGGAIDSGKKAVNGALNKAHDAADRDGDGKLSLKDVSAGYDQAKDWAGKKIDDASKFVSTKKDEAIAWGGQKLDDAKKAMETAAKFADRNGDGQLGLDDVKKGASEVYDAGSKAVSSGVDTAKKAVGTAVEWGGKKVDQAKDWAAKKASDVKKGATDLANKAHAAADRDGDGTLGLNDVRAGVNQASKAVTEKIATTQKQLKDGYDAVSKKLSDGYKAAYNAADLNKDGKVDSKDAAVAAQRAKKAASDTYAAGKAKVESMYNAAKQTVTAVEKKATEIKAAAHKAADRDGDGRLGVGDIKAGASQAYTAAKQSYTATKQAVVSGVTNAYNSASAAVSQAGQTLSAGYTAASERVSGAWNRMTGFFGY
jgi:hypothetical protein